MNLNYFKTLSKYNTWANNRLYNTCAELSETEYMQPRESFFGSIHRTLNHIMVADLLWLSRFVGEKHQIRQLDQELYPNLAELTTNRKSLDHRIEGFVEKLTEGQLAKDLHYSLLSRPGETTQTPMLPTLGHFFNHQTHHRGQVHGLLSQTQVSPPPLDLLYFIRGE